MSTVAELDPLLQSLPLLKPPGVSKGKIAAITTLCIQCVQSDAVIIQRIYTHFKRTPSTHKLGVLYVVDSIIRQWIEKARHAGQDLSSSGTADGTFASGVQKITELMPILVNDTIKSAPEDQKTPAGSPPPELLASLGLVQTKGQTQQHFQPPPEQQQPFRADQSTGQPAGGASSILAALATMGRNPSTPQPPSVPTHNSPGLISELQESYQTDPQQSSRHKVAPPQGAFQHSVALPANQVQSVPTYVSTYAPPLMPPAGIAVSTHFPNMVGGSLQNSSHVVASPDPLAALGSLIPPEVRNNLEALAQQVQLLQGLQQAGIPYHQWGEVLKALGPPQLATAAPQAPVEPGRSEPQAAGVAPPDQGAYSGVQSEQQRQRDRSRSPDSRRDRHAPATNRRPSPVYGEYRAPSSGGNNQTDSPDRDGRGRGPGRGTTNEYRQRSPLNRQFSPAIPPGTVSKWTDYDPSLLPNSIRVLSRTLFVGGANGTEAELRQILSRFGQVQTCIVNRDKRHAFVKMVSREDAVAAKAGMEGLKDPDMLSKARQVGPDLSVLYAPHSRIIRQVKWGVGYGPRECCDYNTGISVIPIDALTQADIKWMHSAPYGGCGEDKKLEPGLVVEEPDIEIGHGVSSKAISRRVNQFDNPGKRGGPRGGRGGFDGGSRFRQPEPRNHSPRPNVNTQNTLGVPPPVPGFGFQFDLGNGRPTYG
ncbi:hypothetical protein LTR04_000131 [Oleoguttula sp. CCFEE 6159]|nr:hypothetical protein LTR04_000131 [Oleoguttula sp. CCFEE 6159]